MSTEYSIHEDCGCYFIMRPRPKGTMFRQYLAESTVRAEFYWTSALGHSKVFYNKQEAQFIIAELKHER